MALKDIIQKAKFGLAGAALVGSLGFGSLESRALADYSPPSGSLKENSSSNLRKNEEFSNVGKDLAKRYVENVSDSIKSAFRDASLISNTPSDLVPLSGYLLSGYSFDSVKSAFRDASLISNTPSDLVPLSGYLLSGYSSASVKSAFSDASLISNTPSDLVPLSGYLLSGYSFDLVNSAFSDASLIGNTPSDLVPLTGEILKKVSEKYDGQNQLTAYK